VAVKVANISAKYTVASLKFSGAMLDFHV